MGEPSSSTGSTIELGPIVAATVVVVCACLDDGGGWLIMEDDIAEMIDEVKGSDAAAAAVAVAVVAIFFCTRPTPDLSRPLSLFSGPPLTGSLVFLAFRVRSDGCD